MRHELAVQQHLEPTLCFCILCQRDTNHDCLTSVRSTWQVGDDSYYVDYSELVQTLRCGGCDSLTIKRSSNNSENYDFDDRDARVWTPDVDYFPARSAGGKRLDELWLLPQEIQRIYQETVTAINNDLPVLAAVGMRAIIERVCADRNAAGKNLDEKTNSLASSGGITQDHASILHTIRGLGNKAAHETAPHSPEHLKIALQVVEHTLSGTYIIPFHAKRLAASATQQPRFPAPPPALPPPNPPC